MTAILSIGAVGAVLWVLHCISFYALHHRVPQWTTERQLVSGTVCRVYPSSVEISGWDFDYDRGGCVATTEIGEVSAPLTDVSVGDRLQLTFVRGYAPFPLRRVDPGPRYRLAEYAVCQTAAE